MEVEAATSEIYYHGTSSEFAKEILSKGLLPEPPKRAWDKDSSLESFPGVYLTKNILSAIQAAGASIKKFGGHPVVFEVQIEKKTGLLDEDELPSLLPSLDKANEFRLNEHYAKQFMDPKADEATKKWEEEYLDKGTEFYLARLKDYIGHELHEKEKERLRPLIKNWGRAWIKQIALTHREEQKKIPEYREAMDKVVRALKILPKMDWKTNIRITKPIGFRGANRILSATAFVNYPRPETDEAYILKPLYGKPSQKMIDSFHASMGGKIQVTAADKKDELKEKYGKKKENTYLYFPVTINGEDDYHLTVKFLGICSATKEEILEAMKGIDKTPPKEFQWRPIEWDSKNDGKVKVLELLGTPENLGELHDSLEDFREDEYDEYRPHITVENDLWEKIKRDEIQPGMALVQVGPLSIDVRGEKFYLVRDKKAEAAGWYSWEPEPIYDHQPSELPAQNTGGPFMGAPGDTFIEPQDEFDVRLNKDGANASVTAETYEDEGHVGKHWGSQASGIAFVSNVKVLLLKRSSWVMDPNVWGIPGGAVPVSKEGKPMDVKQSAIKEVTEEMGGIPPYTDTGKQVVFQDEDFKYTTFLFEVPETFEPLLNHEHERAQWFPLDQLPEDIHPGVSWALGQLKLTKVEAAKKESCPTKLNLYRGVKGYSTHALDPVYVGDGYFGRGTYYAFDPEVSKLYAFGDDWGIVYNAEIELSSVLCLEEGKNVRGLPYANELVILDLELGESLGGEYYTLGDRETITFDAEELTEKVEKIGYDAVSLRGIVDGGEQFILTPKADPNIKIKKFSVLTPDKRLALKISKITGNPAKLERHIVWTVSDIPMSKAKKVDPILDKYTEDYMEKITWKKPESNVKGAAMEETFLPQDLVMVDCEMTGVQPKRDKLLQVAMLKLKLQDGQYVENGEPLELFLHNDGSPQNEFQKEHLTEIFKRCNESNLQPGEAKEKICDWLGELKGKAMPCGDCVSTDMAFLKEHGLIDEGDVGDEGQIPGTFHYETFEMHPIKLVARHKTGAKHEVAGLDEENIHNALVDCRNQTLELNHFLKVLAPDEKNHISPAEPTNAAVKPQQDGVPYPSVSWIRDALNQFGFDLDFEDAYIAGSVAKGVETEDSDLDIILPLITTEMDLDDLNTDLVNVLGGELSWCGRKLDFKAVMVDNIPKEWDLIPLKASIYAAAKELPEPLRPSTRDDRSLPDSTEAQLKSFEGKALRCDTFQDFQELLSDVLVKLELTEEYRKSVAGILNQFRERKGYVAL